MPPKKYKGPFCEFRLSGANLPIVMCQGWPAARAAAGGAAYCNVHQRQVRVQAEPPAPPSRASRVARAAGSSFASSFDLGRFMAGIMGEFMRPEPPPPPSSSGGMSPMVARLVMGFDAGEVLTTEKISARRREFARKYHPDRQGGDTGAMQELNAAAEILLAGLG